MHPTSEIWQVVSDLKASVAALNSQVTMLLWFVGGTMLPVWLGFFTALWKASHIIKFLEKEKKP